MKPPESQQTPIPAFGMSDHDFKEICSLTHNLTGIHLHEGKRELVAARLGKRIRKLGLKTLGDYVTYVREQKTQEELTSMLDALTTNLTSFWRESSHFDYLVSHLLPRWTANAARTREKHLRVWSAGCSTGEEPYGIAMLLQNALDQQRVDLKILATDLSTKVLGTAKEGVYDAERITHVPSGISSKYFIPERNDGKNRYRVHPQIRSIVSFSRLNLMESWPMKGPFDFIFCRNVMIYFEKPTQQVLVNRFYDLLRKSGVLFVGHSESLAGINHKFGYLQPTIYEKS